MFVTDFARKLRRRRDESREVRSLAALDDHTLSDLGIHRSAIPVLSAKARR